jgi:hypothetical protein
LFIFDEMVRQRVSKGNLNWNHTVTLEGKLNDYSPLNFVYWLNSHLKRKFKLTLNEFSSWKSQLTKEQGNQRIWKWNKDAMRETFKSRCKLAGYPSGNEYFIILLYQLYILTDILNRYLEFSFSKIRLYLFCYYISWFQQRTCACCFRGLCNDCWMDAISQSTNEICQR